MGPAQRIAHHASRLRTASSITVLAACSVPAPKTVRLAPTTSAACRMRRIDNPNDNAKAERFMRALKKQEVDGRGLPGYHRCKKQSVNSSKPLQEASASTPHSIICRRTTTRLG
jgi:hypothetical protein